MSANKSNMSPTTDWNPKKIIKCFSKTKKCCFYVTLCYVGRRNEFKISFESSVCIVGRSPCEMLVPQQPPKSKVPTLPLHDIVSSFQQNTKMVVTRVDYQIEPTSKDFRKLLH